MHSRLARRRVGDLLVRLLCTAFVGALVVVWSFPLVLTVMTSLKPTAELQAGPLALPRHLDLSAYAQAWDMLDLKRMLWNSAFISVVGTAIAICLAIFPAFALVRFKFRGANVVFIVLLTGMMFPAQGVVIPLYDELSSMKLLGSLWGLALIHGAYGLPYVLFLLRGFIAGIPRELECAARVDGCSDVGVFRHVILPLLKPAIGIAATLNVISIWNELFFAVVFLSSSDSFPVSAGLVSLRSSRVFTAWNLPAAAMLIAQLPTIILYIVAYRYIKQGIYSGAVKG